MIEFLLNLKIANKRPMNKPNTKDKDKSLRVTLAAISNFGKLKAIIVRSIKNPYYI
jgi:hypothetical protein